MVSLPRMAVPERAGGFNERASAAERQAACDEQPAVMACDS